MTTKYQWGSLGEQAESTARVRVANDAATFIGAADLPHEATINAAITELIAVAGPGGSFSPGWFGATGDGTHDDTAAIQAAFAACSAAGGGVVTMPPGTYKLSLTGASPGGVGHYALLIPSNVTLRGVPGRSTFLNGGMILGTPSSYYDALTMAPGTSNVVIEGISFLGQNNPFVFETQLQMACIEAQGGTSTDIIIRNCTFDNQYGFTVHNEGGGQRIHVLSCAMRNCANGLNVNADYSIQSGNRLLNVESIEAGGAYTIITKNILEGAGSATVGGISLGGRTSPGSLGPGVICVGNAIVDSPGTGIAINDGVTDSIVAHNIIIRSSNAGIELVSGGFNPIARVQVTNNAIADAGLTTGGASTRVGVYCQANTGGRISGNIVSFGAATGHDTFYGIEIPGAIDSLTVADNILKASSTGIIFPSGGNCTNLTLARNAITAPLAIDQSAATLTFAPDLFTSGIAVNGALQLGMTTVAATPSTVVRKFPVYDTSGTLLGYVPIYNTIT